MVGPSPSFSGCLCLVFSSAFGSFRLLPSLALSQVDFPARSTRSTAVEQSEAACCFRAIVTESTSNRRLKRSFLISKLDHHVTLFASSCSFTGSSREEYLSLSLNEIPNTKVDNSLSSRLSPSPFTTTVTSLAIEISFEVASRPPHFSLLFFVLLSSICLLHLPFHLIAPDDIDILSRFEFLPFFPPLVSHLLPPFPSLSRFFFKHASDESKVAKNKEGKGGQEDWNI